MLWRKLAAVSWTEAWRAAAEALAGTWTSWEERVVRIMSSLTISRSAIVRQAMLSSFCTITCAECFLPGPFTTACAHLADNRMLPHLTPGCDEVWAHGHGRHLVR